MSAASPILEVRGLEKEYPGVHALKGVDFDVLPGEVHCLLGPNGAGKSTLIKCVSGVVEPTRGEAPADGMPLFADGMRSAQIVEAVLASARKQEWVDVPAIEAEEVTS